MIGVNRDELTAQVSQKLKMIRVEANYTQDKLADVLGISKKTVVQIEKERLHASWTVVVAICALFRESEILQSVVGNDPIETVEVAAHEKIRSHGFKTMGGHIWWNEIGTWQGYRLQQNTISNHYRILDANDYRIFSTTDKKEAMLEFQILMSEGGA